MAVAEVVGGGLDLPAFLFDEAARFGGMPPAPTNASAPWRWPDRFKCQLLTDEKALAAANCTPCPARISSLRLAFMPACIRQ